MIGIALGLVRGAIAGAPILSVVLALLGGTLGAGFGVHGVETWWFEHVKTPQIQKAQQAADAATYEDAAAAAQKATELAKFKAIEAVTQDFYEQQQVRDAADQAALDELNRENADYEKQLQARGRSYVFDQSDVDYLNGVWPKP